MRLSRIYTDNELDIGISIDLPVASSHYINHVLRLKNSQEIILFNGRQAFDYRSAIEITKKKVSATPISRTQNNVESPVQTTLFQAAGKSEHIDFIIQKATELGISKIHLFNSQRTQTHLKGNRLEKKITHWKSIIISACEQCGRNKLPDLHFQPSLQHCLSLAVNSNKLILDFNGKPISELSSQLNPDVKFSMLIGPEGGFSEAEIELARGAGFLPCILGPRTLRMETAALSIINVIQHRFGDMP